MSKEREEREDEYQRRYHDEQDRDSWQGVDTVGARTTPIPHSRVMEVDMDDHLPLIIKRRSGY